LRQVVETETIRDRFYAASPFRRTNARRPRLSRSAAQPNNPRCGGAPHRLAADLTLQLPLMRRGLCALARWREQGVASAVAGASGGGRYRQPTAVVFLLPLIGLVRDPARIHSNRAARTARPAQGNRINIR